MKNYVQDGETITMTAPYDVASGAGLLVGSIFAVANAAALSGATVEADTTGVFDLAKVSAQAWATVGLLIYWDNAAKNCTTTVGTNKLIGVNVSTAANPSATGRVRLNGAFIS
jgi:predicted RecA/RadA family phage recombinase